MGGMASVSPTFDEALLDVELVKVTVSVRFPNVLGFVDGYAFSEDEIRRLACGSFFVKRHIQNMVALAGPKYASHPLWLGEWGAEYCDFIRGVNGHDDGGAIIGEFENFHIECRRGVKTRCWFIKEPSDLVRLVAQGLYWPFSVASGFLDLFSANDVASIYARPILVRRSSTIRLYFFVGRSDGSFSLAAV